MSLRDKFRGLFMIMSGIFLNLLLYKNVQSLISKYLKSEYEANKNYFKNINGNAIMYQFPFISEEYQNLLLSLLGE